MITYTVKIIDSEGGVRTKHEKVGDIALFGKDVQILFKDGHETNERITSKQRIEVQLE